jgi:hypothetical protein
MLLRHVLGGSRMLLRHVLGGSRMLLRHFLGGSRMLLRHVLDYSKATCIGFEKRIEERICYNGRIFVDITASEVSVSRGKMI